MIKKNYSELFELTDAQIARLRKEYMPFKGKTLPVGMNRKIDGMLDRLSTQQLVKLANTDIPVIATAAKGVAVMKRGMKYKDFKQGLDMGEADELQCEACWSGYKQVGLKKKGDRMVPNCVPESKELLDMQEADLSKRQVKMVHKAADKLDKKDFMKRYGKDGDSVRYATATNMVKKKLGIDEQRALSSPEVAATLRQFIAQRPFIDNKKDYEELMRLAAKDMGMFNARLNRMNDQTKEKVKSALQRKGLTSHLTNEKEPKGDKPMQEQSYKDKFNATMKDFGIKSLGDLKSDEEKKKFFKAVDAKHDAKDEELEEGLTPAQKKLPAGLQKAIAKKQDDKKEDKKVEEGFASDAQRKAAFASGYKEKGKDKKEMMKMKASYKKEDDKKEDDKKSDNVEEMMSAKEMMKMNAMKMPIRAMYMKAKKEMKTGDDDMKPMTSMKMNAVTDPKKMNAMAMQDPKQDMAAGYMKSDVRAAVKDGGGADMAKVKDKPVMQEPMKKINAMYMKKESKRYLETKPGSLEEAVLVSRGLVEKK